MSDAKVERGLIELMRNVCEELGIPEEKSERAPIAAETAQCVLTHIQNRCRKERGHNYDGDGVCLNCWFDQYQNAIQVPK